MEEEHIRPLAAKLPAGHVDSLEHLSSELAAAALTDLFLRTGSAQARVTNPDGYAASSASIAAAGVVG